MFPDVVSVNSEWSIVMVGIGRGFSRFPKFWELSSSAIWPLRISSWMPPPRASSLGAFMGKTAKPDNYFHWWILWQLLSGEQKGLWDTLQLIYLTKLQNLDFILGFTMFFQRYHKPAYIIVPKCDRTSYYIMYDFSGIPKRFYLFSGFFFMVNPHPPRSPNLGLLTWSFPTPPPRGWPWRISMGP